MGRNARIISVRFTYSDDSSDEMDSSLSFFLRMLLTASQLGFQVIWGIRTGALLVSTSTNIWITFGTTLLATGTWNAYELT